MTGHISGFYGKLVVPISHFRSTRDGAFRALFCMSDGHEEVLIPESPPHEVIDLEYCKAGGEMACFAVFFTIFKLLFLFGIKELGQSVAGKLVAKCLN